MIHPLLQSSTCTTSTRRTELEKRNLDNGYYKGATAVSLVTKEYVAARIAVSNNVIPDWSDPFVDFRIVVWDFETRYPRAWSGNLADELNAMPRGAEFPGEGIILTADFLEPIELQTDERVILGDAVYGDYPLRQVNLASRHTNAVRTLTKLSPQLSFRTVPPVPHTPETRPEGGYEGGDPEQIGDDSTGNYPWVELI